MLAHSDGFTSSANRNTRVAWGVALTRKYSTSILYESAVSGEASRERPICWVQSLHRDGAAVGNQMKSCDRDPWIKEVPRTTPLDLGSAVLCQTIINHQP